MSHLRMSLFLTLPLALLALGRVDAQPVNSGNCFEIAPKCTNQPGCITAPGILVVSSTHPDQGTVGGVALVPCGATIIGGSTCGKKSFNTTCDFERDDGHCDCSPGNPHEPCQEISRLDFEAQYFAHSPAAMPAPPTFPPVGDRNMPGVEQPQRPLDAAQRSALHRLRGLFTASSLHMRSSAWISIAEGSVRVGAGAYEYWSRGEMFRTRSHAVPELERFSDSESAYDRVHYQHLTAADARLRLTDSDYGLLEPIRNPLFMAVPFLYLPYDDYCGVCTLTPAVASDKAVWEEILARGWSTKDGSIILPGGALLGRSYYFRLQKNDADDIEIIESIFLDGEMLSAVHLHQHSRVPGVDATFPRDISLSLYQDGAKTVDVHYHVNELRANIPVADDLFTLKHDRADVILDVDEQSVLKHYQILREEWAPRYQ